MPFNRFVKGFHLFQQKYFKNSDVYQELTSNGQHPEALVIACCDSRNDPALLMQSQPGDLFVVRNVAAIVPPYQPDDNYHGTSAAIEFAVKGLKVKEIIVLGHSMCGGVHALANQSQAADEKFEFLTHWISIGDMARQKIDALYPSATPEHRQCEIEKEVIVTSLNNLMTFPWVHEAVETGRIKLNGWYFDMKKGVLLDYDMATGTFAEMKNPHPEEFVHFRRRKGDRG